MKKCFFSCKVKINYNFQNFAKKKNNDFELKYGFDNAKRLSTTLSHENWP